MGGRIRNSRRKWGAEETCVGGGVWVVVQVENLKHLRRLQLLDLSNNNIEKLDPGPSDCPAQLGCLSTTG